MGFFGYLFPTKKQTNSKTKTKQNRTPTPMWRTRYACLPCSFWSRCGISGGSWVPLKFWNGDINSVLGKSTWLLTKQYTWERWVTRFVLPCPVSHHFQVKPKFQPCFLASFKPRNHSPFVALLELRAQHKLRRVVFPLHHSLKLLNWKENDISAVLV